MKNKLFIFIVSISLLYDRPLLGQIDTKITNELRPEQVVSILKKYHPVLRQAAIKVEVAENNILNQRGSFDPRLSGGQGAKTLRNESYYEYTELGVEIPTWFGIDFEGGFVNQGGQRLDNSLTQGDVSYLGVTVPLLKNLIYDKRRGYLEQAKIMSRMTQHEQANIVNNILLDAMKTYWDWVKAYESYRILDELVKNNLARNEFVTKSIGYGERPAIDSIEVKTQLLSFQIEKEKRWTEFLNAGNELSVFLWLESGTPYQIPANVKPSENWDTKYRSYKPNLIYESILEQGLSSHPEIKMYQEQISYYRVDRKIYFQELLPKLDFNYKFLNNAAPQNFQINDTRLFSNNYQYSLKLDVPLRLSEGRSNLRNAKLKLNYGELALQQKKQGISIKIKNYFNNYLNYEKLSELQYENFENYSTMVRAEETKFRNGESNLFTINAREVKALEAQEKLIELKTSYLKSIYEVRWSAGLLR